MLVLLAFGADPNCTTAAGETPLSLAVEGGCSETIQVGLLCWV